MIDKKHDLLFSMQKSTMHGARFFCNLFLVDRIQLKFFVNFGKYEATIDLLKQSFYYNLYPFKVDKTLSGFIEPTFIRDIFC